MTRLAELSVLPDTRGKGEREAQWLMRCGSGVSLGLSEMQASVVRV